MSQEVKKGTEGKITQKMIDDVSAMIGVENPAKDQYNSEATRDTVKHYAEGIGDLNPLWLDAEYAKKGPYGGLIAPPTFLDSCAGRVAKAGFPGIHGFNCKTYWYFYKPVRVGYSIFTSGGMHALEEKKSRFSTRSFLQTQIFNYRNQYKELLATVYQGAIRSERSAAASKGKYKDVKKYEYTQEELQNIWDAIDNEEVRGADPRYWEDVQVGDELTPVVKGPLVLSDIIGFKMGWGSHYVHHIRANEARIQMIKRHPRIPMLDTLGLPDVPEAVHMVDETSTAIGFPAWYDYGYQRVAWAAHLMTNWIGDDGWLKELDMEVRLPNIHGDTQWYKGHVTKKWMEKEEPLVECKIWAENQRGEITAPGRAVVRLPSKK